MNVDSLNRWLTLGANIGVLIGIFLLVAELNQNSALMRAQIFNERANQGIDLFSSVSESPALSETMTALREAGWPEDVTAYSKLTPIQQTQFRWYLRSNRFRIENLLYQQIEGILEYDEGMLLSGYAIIRQNEAVNGPGGIRRLRRLVAEVAELHEEAGL